MKKITYVLSALVLILSLWAVALWVLPIGKYNNVTTETRYGTSEGMQLVEQTMTNGERQYVVEDARGNVMFRIPLRGCMLDTQFRGGRLRFRELSTGREGYVDMQGIVVFTATSADSLQPTMTAPEGQTSAIAGTAEDVHGQQPAAKVSRKEVRLPAVDVRTMAHNSPFYAEASKIISGKLEETDATRRRQILNYCERHTQRRTSTSYVRCSATMRSLLWAT